MKRHPISGAVAVKRDGPRGWHWVAAEAFDPALHQPHDPEAEAKAAEAKAAEAERLQAEAEAAQKAEAERLAAEHRPETAQAAEAPAPAPAAATPARKRAGSTTNTTEA